MAIDVTKVEGFEELNAKLKQLNDGVKRNEVLKIQRRLAKPIAAAYSQKLPQSNKPHTRYVKGGGKTTYTPGNLSRSVRVKTVGKRAAKGNPSLQILPDKTKGGRNDGYYRFMVVAKGFKGSGRGSRKGKNTVVEQARNATLAATQGRTTKEAEVKTAAYIQKRINKLSS
ncbi:hypothetical protein [Patiriisocius marinus]|uniref:hypothetical protein n=1 Tax=Patiriisocius marinus TaxID=1397112 RepID=UPI00232C8EBA|nr:hypothetical protein [Patiriisocius marinus]